MFSLFKMLFSCLFRKLNTFFSCFNVLLENSECDGSGGNDGGDGGVSVCVCAFSPKEECFTITNILLLRLIEN